MNGSQLRLRPVGVCSRIDCEKPATWRVWPGPTLECDEHVDYYRTAKHWKGVARIERLEA